MAARRYEISLRVSKYIFQHQERNFVSPTDHVMFCLLLIFNTDEIPNHFTCAPIIAIRSNRRQKNSLCDCLNIVLNTETGHFC